MTDSTPRITAEMEAAYATLTDTAQAWSAGGFDAYNSQGAHAQDFGITDATTDAEIDEMAHAYAVYVTDFTNADNRGEEPQYVPEYMYRKFLTGLRDNL